jgi:hypothetical protein
VHLGRGETSMDAPVFLGMNTVLFADYPGYGVRVVVLAL